MKALNYIRTSTDDQHPENQLDGCKTIYKEEWDDVEVLEEQQSAWKDKVRPVFEAMRTRIKQGTIDHLVVWDLDRLYRNRKKLIEFFKFCKIHCCKIHSFRQQFFESLNDMPEPWNEAMFDFMLQIMGWLAEEESNKKSERVKAAVRKKGDVTTSYKGNKWGRKKLSTQRVNLIKSLYEQGKGLRAISRELGISVGSVHKYIPSNHRVESTE